MHILLGTYIHVQCQTFFISGIPENLATFNIQFGGPTTTINEINEIETSPVTLQLEEEDEANQVVDLVNEVIDSEIEAAVETTTEAASDDEEYMYEYVYYYYDEDGVNGTVVDIKPANSLTKIQNISAEAVNIHTNIGNIIMTFHYQHILFQVTHPQYTQGVPTTLILRKWTMQKRVLDCPYLVYPSPPYLSALVLVLPPPSARCFPMVGSSHWEERERLLRRNTLLVKDPPL